MQISVFSFLMSVMWGNILAVLIHLCRKTHFFIYRYGITGLLLLYLLCALRIAVPIEFKDIKAVALKGAVSAFYHCVYIEKIGTSPVSVVGVLSLVWAFVAFVLLLRFGIQYGRAGYLSAICFRPEKGGHKETAPSHSPSGLPGFEAGNTGTVPDRVGGTAAGKEQSRE